METKIIMLSINKKKLESGSNTTRAELTSAFGLNGQGGVEPSIKNKKLFFSAHLKKAKSLLVYPILTKLTYL